MGQHLPPQLKQNRRLAPTPRLKSGTSRITRPDGVYIGAGERAILLQSNGAAAITSLLDGSNTRVDIAAKTGAPKERIEQILIALENAGLLDRDFQECAFTPAIAERMIPELSAIAFRPHVNDGGGSLLAKRQKQRVLLHGGDRVGMTIATTLAASGVGQVQVVDDGQIAPVDVFGSSVRFTEVGASRQAVADQRIREAAPVEAPIILGPPDLIILTKPPMPEEVMDLGLTGTTHLVIDIDPDSATVGPLVIPGSTACTRCIALRKVDHDRHWGAVEMVKLNRRVLPSALLAQLTASHASAQALLFLDSGTCTAVDTTLHLSLSDGFIRPRSWKVHPLCGCSWR
jgi:hypothetical protein